MNSDATTAGAEVSSSDVEAVRATPTSTRESIVRATGSGYTQVRHSFVQKYESRGSRASTLAKLVRGRKRRELILYLLVLTCWDEDNKQRAWPSAVWLRALDAGPGAKLTWSPSSLSESWTNLVALKLVNRVRERRRSRITARTEVGKDGYTRPDGKRPQDHYLVLPGVFWTDLWFDRLSLAGLAVLLILLKETGKAPEKHLTVDETAKWYGIGESTAKKGFQELLEQGLADSRDEYVRADYVANGYTVRRYYTLTGAFSTDARQKARDAAAAARRKRAGKKAGSQPRGRAVAATAKPAVKVGSRRLRHKEKS